MALVEILLPPMGESVMEATIINWLKNVGDAVDVDDSILEVATDKVDTEVPSPEKGILEKIIQQKGAIVQIGEPIAIIKTDGDSSTTEPEQDPSEKAANNNEVQPSVADQSLTREFNSFNGGEYIQTEETKRFYSPLVKNIARQEKISVQELENIPGTGQNNRVTKNDILDYIQNRSETGATGASIQEITLPGSEILEMDRMRKMIADRMLESQKISAHVSSIVEADLTKIVKWREANKHDFEQKFGVNITFTAVIAEAVVNALKLFPRINISVAKDKIIQHRHINLGVAVALANGNLIVPVIKQAEQLNLVGLATKINELAQKARKNQLSAEDVTGGTYTITNIGTFGNLMGTPIILQPQVAIMGFGAIVKKPAVIETPEGDLIGIRHKMFLSHTYDHRVIDGYLGGTFVKKVADLLEDFDPELL